MGNVWLSTAEETRVKQELFKRAMNQSQVMQHLLSAVVAMRAVVEDSELGYASKVEVLDHLWAQYSCGPGQIDTTHHDNHQATTHQVLQEITISIRNAKERREKEKREELRKQEEKLFKEKVEAERVKQQRLKENEEAQKRYDEEERMGFYDD